MRSLLTKQFCGSAEREATFGAQEEEGERGEKDVDYVVRSSAAGTGTPQSWSGSEREGGRAEGVE